MTTTYTDGQIEETLRSLNNIGQNFYQYDLDSINHECQCAAQIIEWFVAERKAAGQPPQHVNGDGGDADVPDGMWRISKLIERLTEIHKRFGNTCVWTEKFCWGSNALWAHSEHEAKYPKQDEIPADPSEPAKTPVRSVSDEAASNWMETHGGTARKAMDIAEKHGQVLYPDIDEKEFWRHEIRALDKAITAYEQNRAGGVRS